MQDFKKLRVWQAAHFLSLEVHRSCDAKRFANFPGRRSQTLRCADSIAANISEGSAKQGKEFARYLDLSLGSTKELENHLIFARDADLISRPQFERLIELVEHVRRMLIKLIRAVRSSS
jgi:four helix bundle protein